MIVDIAALEPCQVDELAQLSWRAARPFAPNWLVSIEAAKLEIETARDEGKAVRVLMDDEVPRGWVAAGPAWGRLWELHPLLVDPDAQGHGYGRELVTHIEGIAHRCGALTMFLSTSDEIEATTLSGVDLYDDPLGELERCQLRPEAPRHALDFWKRMGYSLVGVYPDAEGPGMPAIHFAKRLTPRDPETAS